VWLLITLPEPVLILLFVGLLLSIVVVASPGASGGRAERLEASLDREEGDHPPYRIDAFKAFASARPFVRPPNIFDAGSVGRGAADFYIMMTRTNLHLQTGLPASAIREDLRVERDGAPFCVVFDLR
jgi:hypothetical protein